MAARRRARFEASGPRFPSGGGIQTYVITVERDTGIVLVRPKRRRAVATTTLFGVAQLVMDRHYATLAAEARRAKAEARRARRGQRKGPRGN